MSPRDKSAAAQRRAEREEAERLQAEAAERRKRLLIAISLIVVLVLAIAVILLVASSDNPGPEEGGGSAATGDAFIEPLSGSDNGVAPDERAGPPPPDLAEGDLEKAAAAAGCELKLDLPDEGNTHLTPDQPPPQYKTNPPTSGDHIAPPMQQADGAYAGPPEAVNYVHSLEHGRVAIHYSPYLAEDDQLALKGVFDEDPAGMLLFPNPDMPYAVAATGWTQLMGCQEFEGAVTLDAIRDFRDIYRGNGPEPVPIELSG